MTYRELINSLMEHENLDDEIIVSNEVNYDEKWEDVGFEIETIKYGDKVRIGVYPSI